MVNLDMREDEVIPTLDGNFEVIQLGDNPIRSMNIGSRLHYEVKKHDDQMSSG